MKPYYEADGITIYHGDCAAVLPELTNIDLIVTSPPYNLGTHPTGSKSGMHAGSLAASDLARGYGVHGDAMSHPDYAFWQSRVLDLCADTLSDRGAIFYNHKPRPMDGAMKLPTDYGPPVGLQLRQIITWDRGTGMNFSASFFLPKSEWIIVWAKPAWRLASKEASQVGDVWRFGPEVEPAHPAPFPVGLPLRVLEATTPGVVMDPFMGSGSTLVAAKRKCLPAVGIEIEERYCEIAALRLNQGVLGLEAG